MSPDRQGPWPAPPVPAHHPSAELLERDLQAKCVAWWKQAALPGLLFHVTNEGKRSRLEAASLRAMGVVAGAPDFMLLLPNGRVHLIELKSSAGWLTSEQSGFLRTARELGHTFGVDTSLEEFIGDVLFAMRFWGESPVVDFREPLPLP